MGHMIFRMKVLHHDTKFKYRGGNGRKLGSHPMGQKGTRAISSPPDHPSFAFSALNATEHTVQSTGGSATNSARHCHLGGEASIESAWTESAVCATTIMQGRHLRPFHQSRTPFSPSVLAPFSPRPCPPWPSLPFSSPRFRSLYSPTGFDNFGAR